MVSVKMINRQQLEAVL